MLPILDGVSGFVLLTLSVGLGAYIRQVYVAATETYDSVHSGELEKYWPLDASYTIERLKNLLYVQKRLRLVTFSMFFFITLASLRLLASAINAIYEVFSDCCLRWYDLVLVIYITIAFLFMWWTHHFGSKAERRFLGEMRAAVRKRLAADG